MIKILFLLTLSFNINLIHSQNKSQCESVTPIINSDCLSHSSSSSQCCYLVNEAGTNKKCSFRPKNSYTSTTTIEGTELFYLDCGIGAGSTNPTGFYDFKPYEQPQSPLNLPYHRCGTINPKTRNDCSNNSQMDNSCCYFKSTLGAGCYSIGRRFQGAVTFDGMDVECSSTFKQISLLLFAVYLMII